MPVPPRSCSWPGALPPRLPLHPTTRTTPACDETLPRPHKHWVTSGPARSSPHTPHTTPHTPPHPNDPYAARRLSAPVQEPVGDLVLLGVGHNGHQLLQLLSRQLTSPAIVDKDSSKAMHVVSANGRRSLLRLPSGTAPGLESHPSLLCTPANCVLLRARPRSTAATAAATPVRRETAAAAAATPLCAPRLG
jgi:hypothetical protein